MRTAPPSGTPQSCTETDLPASSAPPSSQGAAKGVDGAQGMAGGVGRPTAGGGMARFVYSTASAPATASAAITTPTIMPPRRLTGDRLRALAAGAPRATCPVPVALTRESRARRRASAGGGISEKLVTPVGRSPKPPTSVKHSMSAHRISRAF